MLAACEGGGGGAEPAAEAVRAKLTIKIPTVAAEGTGVGGARITGPVVFTSDADDSELGGCKGAVEAGEFKPRRFGFDDAGQDVWAVEVEKSCKVPGAGTGNFGVTYGDFSTTCEVDQSAARLAINFSMGVDGCATGTSNYP